MSFHLSIYCRFLFFLLEDMAIFSFSIRSISSLSLCILWKSKFFYSCLFYHLMHCLLCLYTIRVEPFIFSRLHLILIIQFNTLYSLSFLGFNCCLFFICHSFFFFCFSFLDMTSFPDVVLRQSFPLLSRALYCACKIDLFWSLLCCSLTIDFDVL